MRLGFRAWMTAVALLVVALTVATILLYALPMSNERLEGYDLDRLTARAAQTADAIAEGNGRDLGRALDLAAEPEQREALFVGPNGRVAERAGPRLLRGDPGGEAEVFREAAAGGRMFQEVGGLNVAVTPVLYGGEVRGGVVLASERAEGGEVFGFFLRSGVEAAMLASVLGGGLVLLLASLLSSRVEKLAHGARAIERGDLSYRMVPGFGDELGELARAFNSMAARLQASFVLLEERVEERTAELEAERAFLEERVEERTGELERERRTLDVVLDNLSEGVMAADAEGRVFFANPCWRALVGTSAGGGGLPEGVPDPWGDFDLPRAVARVSEGGEGIVARPGGARTPLLEIRLEPLPGFGGEDDDGEGGGRGVLVVARDLSEGRRLEERQQRFLSDAAHELKTPLTAILGAAELLEEDSEDPEIRRRFLRSIVSEARRMRRLSETLLKLARTGADLREPRMRPVPMCFLKEVAERAEPLVERAGLDLVVDDRGGVVEVDPEWLEQALLILVSNAAKHSERGGRVWLRVDGGTFEVEDEGEGMGEEDLARVFERHYRGEGASSGGFGLGLPICKELVERMGGEIALESEEGVGTTARITLPEIAPDERDLGEESAKGHREGDLAG